MLEQPEPIVDNAADEEQVRGAADQERLRENADNDDTRAELRDEAHRRRVFERLGALFSDVSSVTDPVAIGVFLGRREVALELMQRCSRHRDLFLQMWDEGLKRQKDQRRTRQARRRREE